MKNTDKPRSEKFRFIFLVEHTKHAALDSRKKTVQERTVLKKEMSERIINRENAVTMLDIKDFKRHGSGTINGILIATSRTKSAFTAKRNKFISTTTTNIHGTAEGGIPAVDHLFNIFNYRWAGMKKV